MQHHHTQPLIESTVFSGFDRCLILRKLFSMLAVASVPIPSCKSASSNHSPVGTGFRLFLSVVVCFIYFLLSGCSTPEDQVMKAVEKANLARLQTTYGTNLQARIDDANNDQSGATRNNLLNDLILLVDLNYYHWEKLVYDKKAYSDFGSAVTATTLSSISSIYKVEEVKTVLSAISSGITSTNVSFSSKVLQDQSLTAVLAKMRANRATQLLKLQASMIAVDTKGNPTGPTSLSKYSVQQGLIDIAAYYNAGTFVAALQDIIEKAATEKSTADVQANTLKPNSDLVNATVPAVLRAPPRAPQTISQDQMDQLQAQVNRLKQNQQSISDFVQEIRAYDRTATAQQITPDYAQIVKDAGLAGKVAPDPNEINKYYQLTATLQEQQDLKKALQTQINKLKAMPQKAN